MMNIVGSPGTRASLGLRVIQFLCSTASAVAMIIALYRYVPFRFLSFQMTALSLYSLTLTCLDIVSLSKNWDLQNIGIVWIYFIGDTILAVGSLAAVSSAGGVLLLLEIDTSYCSPYKSVQCGLFKISVILGSIACTSICASAISTSWLLISLYDL